MPKREPITFAKSLTRLEREARFALARMIRLRFGTGWPVAYAWAREWIEAVIEAPDQWPEPIDDDDGGQPLFGEGEDQISFDSAMYRD